MAKSEDKGPNFALLYQQAKLEQEAALVLAETYRKVLAEIALHMPLDPNKRRTRLGSVCHLAQLALEKVL